MLVVSTLQNLAFSRISPSRGTVPARGRDDLTMQTLQASFQVKLREIIVPSKSPISPDNSPR